MATNFRPCEGSYALNQFPSDVMFGMNGFHVSASGAIQGHHGPLVQVDALSWKKGFLAKFQFLALLAESQQSLSHDVVSVVCLSVS